MASTQAPQQYKQHSRKGKRAWRKNVDVTEIQEGLENAREEIIKGGIISEKPAADLFTVDTTGSLAIQRAYRSTHKPLKADEIIAQRSVVPSVDTHKRSSNVTDGILPPKRQRPNSGVSAKDYDKLRERAYGGNAAASKAVFKTSDRPDHDPWAEAEESEDPQAFLKKPKPIKAPQSMKQAPVSLLLSSKALSAISEPKPSASYNPLYEDWTEALHAEGQKELEAELQRRTSAAKEEEKQLLILRTQAEIPEDDMGYYITAEESAWEGFESEYASDKDAAWMKKRRPERKTPAERNKVKRRKEAEGKAKHEMKAKEKEKQAKRIHDIAAQLEAKELRERQLAVEASRQTAPSDSESADENKLRRRKFGPAALPAKNLEIVLPDELQDSLRLLKPEGNLLKDRFRNMMVRGKIETRRPIQQAKKKRRIVTEKWTYKDFTIQA